VLRSSKNGRIVRIGRLSIRCTAWTGPLEEVALSRPPDTVWTDRRRVWRHSPRRWPCPKVRETPITLQDFRRAIANSLNDAGVSPAEIARQLGHYSLLSQQAYLVRPGRQAAARGRILAAAHTTRRSGRSATFSRSSCRSRRSPSP
jgi:integrase